VRRAALFLVVCGVAGGAAAVAYATQSPKALRASILAAAKAQSSVHYTTHEVVGNTALALTADVAAADGRQHVSFKAGKTTGHITILVLDQTAYVQGDMNGLGVVLGLTRAQATTYAGQWISIPKGDKDYGKTAAAVTLGSFLQSITPHGRLSSFKARSHGTRVIGVRARSGKGKKKEVQVLAARAHGKRLPLEEDELSSGQEYISHTALSKWNEQVQVQAPANAVPISTVRAH
jgi:hypothetical protein